MEVGATEAAAMETEAAMSGAGADGFAATTVVAAAAAGTEAPAMEALAKDSATPLPDLGLAGTYAPIVSAQIKRSEVTLVIPTSKFNASVNQLTSLPGSVGGFITSSTFGGGEEYSDTNRAPRTGVVVMRVPSNQFDLVRKRLPSFGKTISEQISGEEVSAQLVDLNARLTSLRLQEDSYRKLFNAAKEIQDIITVQERITEVRTQIEQIGAQRASLQDQVAMSTITVNVREKMAPLTTVKPKPADPVAKETFGKKTSKAWKGGINALAGFLTAIVVVLAALAPFTPLFVLGGLLALWLVRRSRRRALVPVRSVLVDPVIADPVSVPAEGVKTEREDVLV
jgi:Domain of unknown function (DUF4349)